MKQIRKISIIGLLPIKIQYLSDQYLEPTEGVEIEDSLGFKIISPGVMHYSVGQSVYGGHEITDILEKEEGYLIYIKKNGETKPWKKVNHNTAVSVEYDLEY